jgi:hypothetical protein
VLVAKQVADLLTFSRVVIGVYLAWLGFTGGIDALPWVVWLMIADWTGDCLDGRIARRSRISYNSWIGDHDLQVDMAVSLGLLVYLAASGLTPVWAAVFYVLCWGFYFYRAGVLKSMGMLFQAPIYAWFIFAAVSRAPNPGLWLVVWIIAAILLTWPMFPNQVIPNFLDGMRKLKRN